MTMTSEKRMMARVHIEQKPFILLLLKYSMRRSPLKKHVVYRRLPRPS